MQRTKGRYTKRQWARLADRLSAELEAESDAHKRRTWHCKHSYAGATVLFVGDASEPGTEWGRYLRRMTKRPGWSVAKLARESQIARQTIFEWIRDGGESVTVGSVRRIADALGDDMSNALLAAGNVSLRDADSEIALILDSDLEQGEKDKLIEHVNRLRETQKMVRRTEVEALLQRPRRAG